MMHTQILFKVSSLRASLGTYLSVWSVSAPPPHGCSGPPSEALVLSRSGLAIALSWKLGLVEGSLSHPFSQNLAFPGAVY